MHAGFPKNPVWFYAILGNRVCILVPCFWGLGFTNSQHTLLMSIESVQLCQTRVASRSALLGTVSLCMFSLICFLSDFFIQYVHA
jgi:hypothetical protein